jgi:DNA repair protein RadC
MEARERLYRLGVASLSDAELLALILGTGAPGKSAREIAENLLCNCGGLKSLGQHYPQELCRIEGIGRARAAQILAALELSKRAQQQLDRRPRLKSPEDIYRHLAPSLSGLRKEVFHVLSFNSRQVLLQDSRVAEGTLNACPVDPREVFSAAIAAHASGIVLAHNHPSGDPEPSTLDVALTRQLVQGGQILGIQVLDHLVLGDGAFTSMLARGQLPRPISQLHLGRAARPLTRREESG